MSASTLTLHPALASNSRLHGLTSSSDTPSAAEIATLVLTGGSAAVIATYLDFSLRVPGHAILRSIVPMTIGLALVPRRGAGTLMGLTALVTALGLKFTGFAGASIGYGALTSLSTVGPLLDLSLRKTAGGRWQYAGFAIAGMASNLLALAVRGTFKATGWEHVGKRPLFAWLQQAGLTYPLCGLVAGLVCGAILFAGRATTHEPPAAE